MYNINEYACSMYTYLRMYIDTRENSFKSRNYNNIKINIDIFVCNECFRALTGLAEKLQARVGWLSVAVYPRRVGAFHTCDEAHTHMRARHVAQARAHSLRNAACAFAPRANKWDEG